MRDGISANINIQARPQMIAQRQVLGEASEGTNTCCGGSHGAIQCMRKSNDKPPPSSGSKWKQNQGISMFQPIFNQSRPRSLVFMSLNRNGSSKSWKPCGYYMVFFFRLFLQKKNLTSQYKLLSTQLVSQERRKKKETSSIPYGPAVPKMQERILVWHRLW